MMKYPFVKTKYNDDCSKENREIIQRYWELEDGSFKIKPTQLSKEIDINVSRLSKLVKTNSKSKLITQSCLVCTNDIEFDITSQTTATSLLEVHKFNCKKCKSEFHKALKNITEVDKKLFKLYYALEYEYWTRLNKQEYNVLEKIIEFDNYFEFKKRYLNANYDFAWTIVEKLNRIGLIDIRGRDYNNQPITEIFFLPELKEILKIDSKKNIYYENDLSFTIPEHSYKMKDTQPDFFKKVIFENDVILKQGVEYFCSVWKNDDGTISLRIKEKAKLFKSQSNQKTPTNEPKQLKDLIPKKWKGD